MNDDEVPTAPPMPTLIARTPRLPPPEEPVLEEPSLTIRLLSDPEFKATFYDSQVPMVADERRCGLCREEFWTGYRPDEPEIAHYNTCWALLRKHVMEKKVEARARTLGETVKQMMVDEGCAELSDDPFDSDDDENTETQTLHNTATTVSAPRIDASSLPKASCLICAADLTRKTAIDAYEHRLNCLSENHVVFCPPCSRHFFQDSGDLLSDFDTLWHMTQCRYGGALGRIARLDFDVCTWRCGDDKSW